MADPDPEFSAVTVITFGTYLGVALKNPGYIETNLFKAETEKTERTENVSSALINNPPQSVIFTYNSPRNMIRDPDTSLDKEVCNPAGSKIISKPSQLKRRGKRPRKHTRAPSTVLREIEKDKA